MLAGRRVHADVMAERIVAAARARRPRAKSRRGEGSRARVGRMTFKSRHAQWRGGGPRDCRNIERSHNAQHHPRPYITIMRGTLMGRRVHAVVRFRRALRKMLVDILAVEEADKDDGFPVESNADAVITDSHAKIIPAAL
jgi:hypothetical protein